MGKYACLPQHAHSRPGGAGRSEVGGGLGGDPAGLGKVLRVPPKHRGPRGHVRGKERQHDLREQQAYLVALGGGKPWPEQVEELAEEGVVTCLVGRVVADDLAYGALNPLVARQFGKRASDQGLRNDDEEQLHHRSTVRTQPCQLPEKPRLVRHRLHARLGTDRGQQGVCHLRMARLVGVDPERILFHPRGQPGQKGRRAQGGAYLVDRPGLQPDGELQVQI